MFNQLNLYYIVYRHFYCASQLGTPCSLTVLCKTRAYNLPSSRSWLSWFIAVGGSRDNAGSVDFFRIIYIIPKVFCLFFKPLACNATSECRLQTLFTIYKNTNIFLILLTKYCFIPSKAL